VEETVRVARRFNGPPDSGNGGYVCGLVGSAFDGPAEVTLHVPPPLERAMRLVRSEVTLRLIDGERTVAEGLPSSVDLEPPATVPFDAAVAAVERYAGWEDHLFPTCFVCGPEREQGDGLRIFPGPVGEVPVVAAPWQPPRDLARSDGTLSPEVVWAALDCPSYFGGPVGTPSVLGRLAVEIRAPVFLDESYVVLGWGLGSEGRKHRAAAAITDRNRSVVAVSRALWIELREPPVG
jgi:hypothetical protein